MNSILLAILQNFHAIYILYFAIFLVAFIWTFVTTFALYAAVIMFRSALEQGRLKVISPSVMFIIKAILYVGLLLDGILNIIFLTVYFWELPKELLSTYRVKRWYWSTDDTRNKRKAIWFAKNWLLPIDPEHMGEGP
jgi:hypothetical protein